MKKLIIFDCDGVLVDTEYVASRIFSDMLASYGYNLSFEESIRQFTGVNAEDARQIIFKDSGILLPENYWDLEKEKFRESRFDPLLKPALELLEELKIPRCIASNSPRSHVLDCLKFTEQSHFFDEEAIFNAEQVPKPKPAPDLFLFAAKEMGFAPEDCIVIEDSVAGTEAAIAAGMKVFVFLGGTHAKFDWYQSKFDSYDKPFLSSCEEMLHTIKFSL